MELLRIHLTEEPQNTWIDNTHVVFKDTEYENVNFKVLIKPLTKSEYANIIRQCTKKSGVDYLAVTTMVFMQGVKDWVICDEKGKKIPCNTKTKTAVNETYAGLAGAISAACVKDPESLQVELELEIKN